VCLKFDVRTNVKCGLTDLIFKDKSLFPKKTIQSFFQKKNGNSGEFYVSDRGFGVDFYNCWRVIKLKNKPRWSVGGVFLNYLEKNEDLVVSVSPFSNNSSSVDINYCNSFGKNYLVRFLKDFYSQIEFEEGMREIELINFLDSNVKDDGIIGFELERGVSLKKLQDIGY